MRTLLVLLVLGPLAGCIVHTRSQPQRVIVRERNCGPAHHWEGNACVHNGHGRGNGRR